MGSKETTAETVKRVIRESLRLDPDLEIPDDMRLLGGEYDLDSLDMLLFVTNLEKAFGIKMPDAELGPEQFSSVGAVVAFIERSR